MDKTLKLHLPGTEHPADLMTKVLPQSKHQYYVSNLLHDIYDDVYCYLVSE